MPTKNILVTGAAGYIGSHMVMLLLEHGYQPIAFDNLSTGHRDAVLGGILKIGDCTSFTNLTELFNHYEIAAVMHFAGSICVTESVKKPAHYYKNNLLSTMNLLAAMHTHGVNKLIFSSTAAVYGEPKYNPIDLNHPLKPINPYGHSKRMIEQLLADYDRAYDLKSITLRYFNAAGADPKGRLGERHQPETHLIPLALQVATEQRDQLLIYGNDYPTPDGTCIRDYIHVVDLCHAHLLALEQLLKNHHSAIYNLGNGQGFSVQQVIDTVQRVTQKKLNVKIAARRMGDPATLIADATFAKQQLGWQPQFDDLTTIIEHAWQYLRDRKIYQKRNVELLTGSQVTLK